MGDWRKQKLTTCVLAAARQARVRECEWGGFGVDTLAARVSATF